MDNVVAELRAALERISRMPVWENNFGPDYRGWHGGTVLFAKEVLAGTACGYCGARSDDHPSWCKRPADSAKEEQENNNAPERKL